MKKTGIKSPKMLTGRELGIELFKIHTHAEIENDANPDAIIYREADIIKLLISLGYPEPLWEDQVIKTKL